MVAIVGLAGVAWVNIFAAAWHSKPPFLMLVFGERALRACQMSGAEPVECFQLNTAVTLKLVGRCDR